MVCRFGICVYAWRPSVLRRNGSRAIQQISSSSCGSKSSNSSSSISSSSKFVRMSESHENAGEELRVFFHACRVGRADIIQHAVKSIKSHNGDMSPFVYSTDENGDTALHIASHNGHADAVRTLLNIGAIPSVIPTTGEFKGKSAYEVASGGAMQAFHVYTFEQIAMGHCAAIRALIEGKVSPDIVDDTALHDSALHWACSFGNVEVATLLLELGGNVNITNANGQTCFHAACKAGNEDFMRILIQHGVDILMRDVSGKVAEEFLPDDADDLRELIATTIPMQRHNTADSPLKFTSKSTSAATAKSPPAALTTAHRVSSGGLDSDACSLVSDVQDTSGYDTDSGWDNETDNAKGATKRTFRTRADGGKYIPHDQGVSTQQIIIWPPAQRQVQYNSPRSSLGPHRPLVLSNISPIIISSASGGIDIYPLLTWSGLVDTFDRMGFTAQVQRGASQAHVKLCINQDVCPGRHRFEIRIDSYMARLTASDATGLMYATHAFIQILCLHADVMKISSHAAVSTRVNGFGGNGSGTAETALPSSSTTKLSAAVGIEVPAMVIVDWPDIPDRGVLWSYRSTVRTQSGAMKRIVRLLSCLRVNQLYLGIDVENESDIMVGHNDRRPLLATKLCSLDEVCRRLFVDLIPTVIITQNSERLPVEILRNFSGCRVSVLLDLHRSNESDEEFASCCRDICTQLMRDTLASGHSTLILACSEVVRQCIGDIQMLSLQEGVILLEHSLAAFLSARLINKSLLSTQSIAKQALARAEKTHQSGSTLALFPAHSESDFFYPAILQKELDDHSLLRPTLNLLLFSPRLSTTSCASAVSHSPSTPANASVPGDDELRDAVLTLLTNPFSLAPGPSSPRKGRATSLDAAVSSASAMARVEGLLWALLSGNGYSLDITVPVSRAEAVECLRLIKSILASVEWSRREEAFRNGVDKSSLATAPSAALAQPSHMTPYEGTSELADIDELMTTLQLFSICCKSIIQAYNAAEKRCKSSARPPEFLSLTDVFDSLSPGAASDLANGLLEAISHCSYRWRRRFERSFDLKMTEEDTMRVIREMSSAIEGQHANKKHDRISCIRSARRLKGIEKWRYVHTTRAEIPGIALFTALCKHIPSYTVDVLLKVVEPSEQLPVVTPSTSSWSLWGSR